METTVYRAILLCRAVVLLTFVATLIALPAAAFAASEAAVFTCVEGGTGGLIVKFASRSDAVPPAKGSDCALALREVLDDNFKLVAVQEAKLFKDGTPWANGVLYTLTR